jgi:hypothetical protein
MGSVIADLACGSCSRRVSEMRGACLMCSREPEAVRLDVEQRVERLLRIHDALVNSTHIYAAYDRSFVEQELRTYGIEPSAPSTERSTTVRTRRKGFGSRR